MHIIQLLNQVWSFKKVSGREWKCPRKLPGAAIGGRRGVLMLNIYSDMYIYGRGQPHFWGWRLCTPAISLTAGVGPYVVWKWSVFKHHEVTPQGFFEPPTASVTGKDRCFEVLLFFFESIKISLILGPSDLQSIGGSGVFIFKVHFKYGLKPLACFAFMFTLYRKQKQLLKKSVT